MSIRNTIPLFAAVSMLAISGAWGADQEDPDIRFSPISLSGQIDVGQIMSGQTGWHESASLNGVNLEGDFIQRTGVWITQQAVFKDRLDLKMGVGGLFWYALPTGGDPSSKLTQFGPGISQATATYTFGDLSAPTFSLQMGFFPYKYNPDSKDLGEYLLRSGVYPNYVVSGGWNMISSAAYMVEGFRLKMSLLDGRFVSDFLLPMEHDVPPMFDLSPTYVATFKAAAGVEVGAGIDCHHCIAIHPSHESPKEKGNQLITAAEFDSTTGTFNYIRDTTSFYTFQGLKLMGRLSWDPKPMFGGIEVLGAQDLKLYGEISVLGTKNYSYMYDDITKRMPMMVGFNIPTFRLLDVLSLEVEYYNTKFPTSLYQPIANQFPTIDLPEGTADLSAYDRANRNDWKWALYAKHEIVRGLQIYAQAASDHFRSIAYNSGPQPTFVPITNRNGKDWYYIIRLQFGI